LPKELFGEFAVDFPVLRTSFYWIEMMTVREAMYVESPLQACDALARAIQHTLVPPISYETSRIEVYGRTIPRDDFGGDLADLVASDVDVVAYVADVSGHDVFAGILMGMVKTAARYGLMFGQALPQLLEGINSVLPSVKEPNMYATFAGMRIAGIGEMEYIIAGNLPALHYRHSRRQVIRLSMEQFPLGMFPGVSYTSHRASCDAGDLFGIFTDGFVETTDICEQEFGLQRLENVLLEYADRKPQEIYDAALDAVGRHGAQADDRTLMLVRVLTPVGRSYAI
jgi:serine phosphatase RsbU (regulator of sigma subunit)